MKILRLIPSVDPRVGGPIEGITRITGPLAALGVQTEVACVDHPDASWLSTTSLSVHPLGPGAGKYGYAPRLVPWIRANQGRFDALVVHGLWQYTGWAAYKAAPKSPYFVYPHGMLDPWFNDHYPLKRLKKTFYWRCFESKVASNAAALIFTSEEERLRARQSFQPYAVRERVVSYGTSGADTAREPAVAVFDQSFPALAGKRFILFLGRVHEKKGVDLLVRAFASVVRSTDLNLVIAGPGDEKMLGSIKKSALELGVTDRMFFPGMLKGAVKWGAFFRADAFSLPSHQENFGIAVAEALSCNVPVLISNKVNIWREIKSAGAGLVGDDTVDGTADVLRTWIQMNRSDKEQMRDAARLCFEQHFNIGAAASSFADVLRAGLEV